MNKTSLIIVALASVLALSACDDVAPSGQKRESQATDQLMNQAAVTVGMPGVMNFTEKRQLKMLYELRDQANLTTYSYYVDMSGKLHKVCPSTSVGFGMPFSAQYTAKDRPRSGYQGDQVMLEQPEPNGIYMPDSTSATWVICLAANKSLSPVYVEPNIIVSLTPMDTVQ